MHRLYIVPTMIINVVIVLVPALLTVVLAFYNWDGISTPTFAGLDNFRTLAADRVFWIALTNNIIWTLVFLTVPILMERARRNLVLAGYKSGWSLQRLMVIKVVGGTIIGFLSFTFFSTNPSGHRFLLFLGATALAFFYPDIWLSGRAQDRQSGAQEVVG